MHACVRASVHACVRAYVRACVRAYVRACMRACVRAACCRCCCAAAAAAAAAIRRSAYLHTEHMDLVDSTTYGLILSIIEGLSPRCVRGFGGAERHADRVCVRPRSAWRAAGSWTRGKQMRGSVSCPSSVCHAFGAVKMGAQPRDACACMEAWKCWGRERGRTHLSSPGRHLSIKDGFGGW